MHGRIPTYGRNRKEVDRHDLAEVIAQKRLPGLRRWARTNRPENPRHGAFRYCKSRASSVRHGFSVPAKGDWRSPFAGSTGESRRRCWAFLAGHGWVETAGPRIFGTAPVDSARPYPAEPKPVLPANCSRLETIRPRTSDPIPSVQVASACS